MRGIALLAVLALSGCGALKSLVGASPPDPKPQANLAHVTRLVAKDPDPADVALNADAVATAKEIAAEADKSADVSGALATAGAAAAGTGTPLGVLIGTILGSAGALFTVGKTIARTIRASSASEASAPAAPAPKS